MESSFQFQAQGGRWYHGNSVMHWEYLLFSSFTDASSVLTWNRAKWVSTTYLLLAAQRRQGNVSLLGPRGLCAWCDVCCDSWLLLRACFGFPLTSCCVVSQMARSTSLAGTAQKLKASFRAGGWLFHFTHL